MNDAGQSAATRSVIESAVGLVQAGRLDDAASLCREHLAVNTEDANLVGMLGAILLRKGSFDEARRYIERAIEMEPRFAKPHEDLGMLLLATGHPTEAIGAFQAAIDLDPQQASAVHGLSTALERVGRHAEAGIAQSRFLALSPDAKALADAAKLRGTGQTERAEKICGELLAKNPRNVRAMRLLARIVADGKRDAAAEGLLRRIMSIEPAFFPAYTDMAQFLVERSRFREAVEMLDQAIAIRPGHSELWHALADTLSIVGRTDDALAAYRKVLELEPDHPYALLGSGHMLRIHGRREEAIGAYRRCLDVRPDMGDAWWYLSTMRGAAFTDAERESMSRQFAAAEEGSASAIALRFALARAQESCEDYEGAWDHYEAANRAKRRTVTYDPVESETQHDALLRTFDDSFMERRRPVRGGSRSVRPIFISGLPRSGSTLIEQILASHSAVEGCGELPYAIMLARSLGGDVPEAARYPEIVTGLSADECLALGDEYLRHASTHRSERTRCFTDKMPANFSHLGFIHLMLPEAVFIDARRNPLDTCVANYRQLFAQGKNQSYDLGELGEYYVDYLRVMQHWQRTMPGLVLTVNYEDVVSDLEGQVRAVLEHCGLPFEESCLRFHESKRRVNTASSEQVREPVYENAVGYWKHYESKLDDLRQIVAPALAPPAHNRK